MDRIDIYSVIKSIGIHENCISVYHYIIQREIPLFPHLYSNKVPSSYHLLWIRFHIDHPVHPVTSIIIRAPRLRYHIEINLVFFFLISPPSGTLGMNSDNGGMSAPIFSYIFFLP